MASTGRGLPALSGIIHERAGMRPYVSAYGHTGTAVHGRAYGAAGPSYGFRQGVSGGYGDSATGLRRSGYARAGLAARERLLRGRRGFAFAGGGYGFGGYGGDFGGFDASAGFGDAGRTGAGSTYGTEGSYGATGTYGSTGTYGGAYLSEVPLAARFAEPALAPSPGAPFGPDDRFADAAFADAAPRARVVAVNRTDRRGCDCGPWHQAEPMVYRYGVGTAY